MQHSVILMDEIDEALNGAGLTPAECDFFSAVVGPGSFTGIRIGISAIKGFALATGKKLLPVTSFELLAYNVTDEKFCTAIDAGRGKFYACAFGKGREIAVKPFYTDAEGVKKLNLPVYGFEDLPFENYIKLDVKNCLLNAVRAKTNCLSDEMSALYVRKSQAEEKRNGA